MTDTQTHDLVVFSAFGRGQWIAAELATRGWNTAVVDLTPLLAGDKVGDKSADKPTLEDIEGPFGLFESHGLLASQRAFLADQGDLHPVASGFSAWLPKGPLEFRSELTPFHVRSHEIPEEVESYLRRAGIDRKESDRERRKLSRLQYSYSWLALLAHSLTAAEHLENHTALEGQPFAPLFSPYSVRQLTEEGVKKALHVCEVSGVTLRKDAARGGFTEIIRDGRSVKSFVQLSLSVNARAFVWCLSFDETKAINENFASKLFKESWPEPQWAWQRVHFEFDAPEILNHLPLSTVLIEDVDLAWTRANLVVLRRKQGESGIDAWIKIPTWMLREKKVLDDVTDEVRHLIESRCPGVHLTKKETGASLKNPFTLWPVYSESELGAIASSSSASSAPNLFFNSPGLWETVDWLGRFHHEAEIVAKLEKLKNQWDAAQRKADAADERRRQRSAQQ